MQDIAEAPSIGDMWDSLEGTVLLIGDEPTGEVGSVLAAEGVAFRDATTARGATCPDMEPPLALVLHVRSSLADALAEARALSSPSAHTPTVLVKEGFDRWETRAALLAEVDGLVCLDSLPEALMPCLRAIRAGLVCVPRARAAQLEPPSLSNREKQILALVVMGESNSQIAKALFVAESTVKSHLSSAFGKLGVRSRNDAVRLILDPTQGLGLGILALNTDSLATTQPAGGEE
jgi:DNA-binding NarL/FixJ family response regulator